MNWDRLKEKLEILADAAKYDVSCSSSGSKRTNTGKNLGDSSGVGICHTYTEDGRCVSLLKILLTNHCIYDCLYCVSRKSNDIKRAAFTVDEVVELTINFYRRNYIEGLFLSSGIFKDADYTMERLVRVAKKLREEHKFNGYIHLKTIPGASDELMRQAGLYADRLSVNMELPTASGLKLLAPEKDHKQMLLPMKSIQLDIQQFNSERKLIKSVPKFAPAGQSSQLIIGATNESDLDVIKISNTLYKQFNLKRVYYSGYVPVLEHQNLPQLGTPVPMVRENRLYQTDWLMRFYGFEAHELINEQHPNLDLEIDPKLAWAIRHRAFFPIDVNKASYVELLRIPGMGVKSAKKVIAARKFGKLTGEQLQKLGIAMNRAKYFMSFGMHTPGQSLDSLNLRQIILQSGHSKFRSNFSSQLSLFA
jgi:putative DNA modification/repair radical SAM protein